MKNRQRLGSGRRAAAVSAFALIVGGTLLAQGGSVSAGDSAGALAGQRRGAAASLSAGSAHTCALLSNDTISCWGADDFGQVGNGFLPDEPAEYPSPESTALPSGRTGRAVAVGGDNSCVRLDNNRLTCWGNDNSGQIGDGPGNDNLGQPELIVTTPETVVSVAVNLDYVCGIFTSGNARCWGSDDDGQLGNGGVADPADVDTVLNAPDIEFPGDSTASAISAGRSHVCAILDDSSLSCWGKNTDGQLGVGSTSATRTAPSSRVALPSGRGVVGVSAGGAHTCALLDNGDVHCWGSDSDGQLGNGSGSADVTTIGPAVNLPGDAVQVATGLRHSCAVLADDTVYCWGADDSGQVGTPGGNADAASPVKIDLPDTQVVALGDEHSCALLDSGEVTCWGSDAEGQLGNGAAGSVNAPSGTTISGLTVAQNAGAPSSPRSVSATGGQGEARLTWEAPLDDGGESITGYRIQQSIDGGATWSVLVANTSSTAVSRTVAASASPESRFRVAAINAVGVSPYSQPSNVVEVVGDLVAFTPVRLTDTRGGGETVDGRFQGGGRNGAGEELRVRIAGRGGAGGVPTGAPAAVLNLTSVNALAGGFATIYPCGDRPNASTLNFPAGANVANAVVARLSSSGDVCVFTNVATHIIIDATGYAPAASDLSTVEPARLYDTRNGGVTVDGQGRGAGPIQAGETREIQIAGRSGSNVPADADTALLNITAAAPAGGGFATVFPCGTLPGSSSLNFQGGVNKANAVVAKLTSSGSVCVFSSQRTQILLDVTGYTTDSTLKSVDPVRLLDSRNGGVTIDNQSQATGPLQGGTFVKVKVAGRGGVPATARLAALSVVAVNPVDGGFLTVYPCTAEVPGTSTLNYRAGQNVPNLAITQLNGQGEVCVFSNQTTNVLIDVTAAQ